MKTIPELVYEGKMGHYLVEVFLASTQCARERWQISVTNGDGRKPAAECSTLDDALVLLLSVMKQDVLDKIYSALNRHHYTVPLDKVCCEAGITLADHQQIAGILLQNPKLALYLKKMPDLGSIDPEARRRIEEQIKQELMDRLWP